MNYKNHLQEHYMKLGKPLPQYKTTMTGGESHMPIWRSTLVANSRQFVAQGPNKKAAEQEVAKQAYYVIAGIQMEKPQEKPQEKTLEDELKLLIDNSIYDRKDIKKEKESEPREKIVLIDADNITVPIDVPPKYPLVRFVFFVSRNGTKDMSGYSGKNCRVRVPPTVTKDAVDHLISFSAGMFVNKYPNVKLIIASRDHFGEALAALCSGQYVCSLKEFEDKIESFATSK